MNTLISLFKTPLDNEYISKETKPVPMFYLTLKEFLKSWWEMLREKILTPDQKFPFTSVFQCCKLDTECALSNKPLCLFEFSYGKISKLRCTNIIKDKSKIKWNTYMLSLHCPQQYFFMNWWEWLKYLIKCCSFFFFFINGIECSQY